MEETKEVVKKKSKGQNVQVTLKEPIRSKVFKYVKAKGISKSAFINTCIKHYFLEVLD